VPGLFIDLVRAINTCADRRVNKEPGRGVPRRLVHGRHHLRVSAGSFPATTSAQTPVRTTVSSPTI